MLKKSKKSEAEQKDFQERKNHLDFVYETNTQIQSLNNAVVSLNLLMEKYRAKAESDHKALLIEIENFKKDILSRCKAVESRMGDLESAYASSVTKINLDLKQLATSSVKTSELHALKQDHQSQIDHMKDVMAKNHESSCASIGVLSAGHKCRIESLRDEIMAMIPKSFPFESEMMEKFRVFKQDFDSLFQETTNLKLAFGSVQRKFEHVCRIEKQQEVNK